MSLLRDQKKRGGQATVQQIKDLARAGKWQDAKNLVDTLPSTPDNIKLKERVEKQLYIATGEVPAVMEGSMALADDDLDAALLEVLVARDSKKTKRTESDIPAYTPIRVVAYLVYGIGMIAMFLAVCLFLFSFFQPSYYGAEMRVNAFVSLISGLFTVASAAMMHMFVDIAQNTFRTNRLLVQLLYKDSGTGDKQDV